MKKEKDSVSDQVMECFICKKVWDRKDAGKWVYHDSIPDPSKVICRHHAGVEEWWQGMLDKTRWELVQGLSKSKVVEEYKKRMT